MLEQEVKVRVRALSAGEFQVLAEAYAEIRWPARYRHLIPAGRNPENATTKGWPDAWAPDPAGSIHVVEASKSRSAWQKHLEEDIENVQNPPRGGTVATFVFVSGKDTTPGMDVLQPRLDDLSGCGLGPADVDFVFVDRLCRELARPEFARIRAEILRLPSSSLPFVPVPDARQLFGDSEAGAFQPTWQEYLERRVHRGARFELICDRLEAVDWAFIRGRGASGKTSLALSVALQTLEARRPAFYVDIAGGDTATVDAIEQRMVVLGGAGVLFIIDNVHLAESLAGRLYDFWQYRRDESRLLLVGRELARDVSRGYGSAIGDLNRAAVDVSPDATDFRGVFRRLARREVAGVPSPPLTVCCTWREAFGGDLLAFCSAVSRRGARNVPPSWQLDPKDAVAEVRRQYIDAVDGEAEQDLLILALFSDLELDAAAPAVRIERLRGLVAEGLLVEGVAPGALRTPHPVLGRLILEAAGQTGPALGVFARIVERDETRAVQVAQRLVSRHRVTALDAWVSLTRKRATSLLSGGLQGFAWTARQLIAGHKFTEAEFDELLAHDDPAWAEALSAASPQAIGNTIGFVFARLPETSCRIRTILRPGGTPADWLVDVAADDRNIRGVALLAGHLRRAWPTLADELDHLVASRVAQAVVGTVAREGLSRQVRESVTELRDVWPEASTATREALAGADQEFWEKALSASPLGETRRCAALLSEDPAVAGAIDSAVCSQSFVDAFAEQHLDSAAPELGERLAELRRLSPKAATKVEAVLSKPGNARRWAERSLRSSLAPLPAVLRTRPSPEFLDELNLWLDGLSDHRLRELVIATSVGWLGELLEERGAFASRVASELGSQPVATAIMAQALTRSCGNAWRLLRHPAAAPVISAIPSGSVWAASRLVHSLGESPDRLEPLLGLLSRLGRQDLCIGAATAFGESIREGRVSADKLSISALSQTLRLAGTRGAEWSEEVAAQVVTHPWLEDQILFRAPAGGLAASIFSLVHYTPAVAALVPYDLVVARAAREAEFAQDVLVIEEVTRLVGAAVLLDGDVHRLVPLLTDKADRLADVLELLVAREGFTSPGSALSWIALRAIDEGGCDPPSHPRVPEIAKQMRAQRVLTERHRRTLDGIAEWLSPAGGAPSSDRSTRREEHWRSRSGPSIRDQRQA